MPCHMQSLIYTKVLYILKSYIYENPHVRNLNRNHHSPSPTIITNHIVNTNLSPSLLSLPPSRSQSNVGSSHHFHGSALFPQHYQNAVRTKVSTHPIVAYHTPSPSHNLPPSPSHPLTFRSTHIDHHQNAVRTKHGGSEFVPNRQWRLNVSMVT